MNTCQVVERASQANASSRQSLTLFVEQMLAKGPLCVRHSTEPWDYSSNWRDQPPGLCGEPFQWWACKDRRKKGADNNGGESLLSRANSLQKCPEGKYTQMGGRIAGKPVWLEGSGQGESNRNFQSSWEVSAGRLLGHGMDFGFCSEFIE